MEGDVENARCSMENLEGSASDKQLRFYRAMTQYANNLVECLQEKVRGHSKWMNQVLLWRLGIVIIVKDW